MQILFDKLKELGINSRNLEKKVVAMTHDGFENLIKTVIDVTFFENQPEVEKSNFSFVANNPLSGASFPCHYLRCRLNNIDTLARNSILYADTVFISNPFEKYIHVPHFNSNVKYELLCDLILLFYVRPLLEKGIFRFTKSYHHICKACLKELNIITKSSDKRIRDVEHELFNIVLNEYSFEIIHQEKQGPAIRISGPDSIIPHSIVVYPSGNYLKRISNRKKRLRLTGKEIVDFGLVDDMVNPVIDDLITQNFYCNAYGASYLTNREIDSVLFFKNGKKNQINEGKKIYDSLVHKLPYIHTVNLKTLLNLREKEGESFQLYRTSLSNFLSNIEGNGKLEQAFNDEVLPELNKINLTLKNSRKLILNDLTKDFFLGSTIVTIGLFTNLLPANINQVLATLGGINYADKFANNVKKLLTRESEIKNNRYYFLWKIKNL
jgi:hypothetical protein